MTQHRPLLSTCALVFLLLFTSSIAYAVPQAPDSFMLKDINTATANANPTLLTRFKDMLYFAAVDKVNGGSLWKSDGTELGTQLVKTIVPGFESKSGITQIKTTSNLLFFTAVSLDRITGENRLFQSDGTTAGTVQITGVFTSVSMMGTTDTFLFFAANDAEHGRELWKTDGTPAGTLRLSDIKPGPEDSFGFGNAWLVGNTLYFSITSANFTQELWKSDGTTVGTTLVKKVSPDDATQGFLEDMKLSNSLVYFTNFYAVGSDSFIELWKTDGTPAGTTRIKQIAVASYVYAQIHLHNNSLFFLTLGSINELWRSDGTEAGTSKLVQQSASFGFKTVSDGSTFYFVGSSNEAGSELWKSDGTIAGTLKVADIFSGTESSINPNASVDLILFQDKLYFAADDFVHGIELWQSDGSEANTKLFKDINPYQEGSRNAFNPYDPIVFNNQLFFTAYNPQTGIELWRSDGTPQGTQLLKDINYVETGDACPAGFIQNDNRISFTASQGTTGYELWSTNGTITGTQMMADFKPGSRSGIANLLGGAGNDVYFVGFQGTDSNEQPKLYASDGTITGTEVITQGVNPLAPDPLRKPYAAYGDSFYLLYNLPFSSGENEYALWKIHGTQMSELQRFTGYVDTFQFAGMREAAGLLFFHANNGETWRSDGTKAGTIRVKSSSYLDLVTLNNSAYWVDSEGLWKSDGTEAGTTQVKAINGSSEIAVTDTHVYIMATDGLWQSDGTETGTKRISDKVGSSLHAAGSHVYFTIPAASQGDPIELWGSDGTSPGTKLLQSIVASQLYEYTAFKGKFYFVAQQSNPLGKALWQSDGTVAGTKQVEDLKKKIDDNASDCGAVLFATADRLYYTGNDGVHGIELSVYDENPPNVGTQYEQFLPLVVR